jgi:hypothetical protein
MEEVITKYKQKCYSAQGSKVLQSKQALGLPAAALDFLPPLGRLLRPHETPAGRGATQ